jgi:DNA repair exonuclease SbcCD ATPase subunit
MNDSTTPTADNPQAPASQEPGFVPAEPLALQKVTTTMAPSAPEEPSAVAQTSTPAANHDKPTQSKQAPSAPPVHTGMSVDERAYQQYQSLAQTVLDSADIAGKSSEAALAVSGQLRKATGELKELSDGSYKKGRLLLAIGGGVMVVCTVFFLVMGVRLVSRINQLDALMEAVGKRVIELNVAMESIESVNRSVQDVAAKQTELTKAQGQIEGRIDASLKQSESVVSKVPGETAKQVAASSDNLLRQVQGINSRLQSQANAVQSLGGEVKSLKSAVGNVDGLKRDVESLITLQKERYLEALQKNNASAVKERALQYPRVAPPKPAETAPAVANAAGPTVAPATKP